MIGKLHRNAPIWRCVLWGAIALTLASWMPTGMSGGGQQQMGGPQQATGSGPAPGGGGAGVQQPITPVGPAPTVPPETLRRLQAFSGEVQAAQRESREGARCERIAAAFASVLPEDYHHATRALATARDEGVACQTQLGQSNARLAELESRAQAFAEDRSPTTAEAAARARAALLPFDRSRVEMDRFVASDRLGEAAQAMLAQSDSRTSAFTTGYDAWRTNRAPGTAAERELAKATSELTAFDRARLPASRGRALEEATALGHELSESERRLDDLAAALAAAQADPEAAADRLLDANGAVRPGDVARADAGQRAALEAAASRGRGLATAKLMERSAQFRANPDNPDAVTSLLRLRPALVGIDTASLSSEQQSALSDLDRAAVRVRDSDRRLASLERALQAFDNERSRATGEALLQALAALVEFDRRRQTGAQAAVAERAEVAASIIRAPQVPRERWPAEVRVFVVPPPGDDGIMIATVVQRALRAIGFRMASTRAGAGLIVEMQALQFEQARLVSWGNNLETTTIQAAIRARIIWGVDGVQLGAWLSGDVRGRGATEATARRNAVDQAARLITPRIVSALE